MTYQRLAYDDASSASEMSSDCQAVEAAMQQPAPSIHFADYPREGTKPQIDVSEAAARLGAALHLHLD